jgi:hypothetical protein
MNIRILIAASCIAFPFGALGGDAVESPSDSITPGDTVYISNEGATPLRQTLALRVESRPQVALPTEIDFRCTVISTSEYDDIAVGISIEPLGGPVLYKGGLVVNLVPGEKEVLLRWNADSELADGDYDVLITAERPDGSHMASTRLRLRKLSYGLVSETLTRASDASIAMGDHVSRLGEESFPPAAIRWLAIARETIREADEAWRDTNWPAAYDQAREALRIDSAVRTGLTFAALTPERFAESPSVESNALTIRNGTIKSGDTPVFLFGVRLSLEDAEHVAGIARFGMNAVVLEFGPADVLTDPDTVIDLDAALDPILDACAAQGVAVALQLQPQKMAGWALDQWPEMARTQFDSFHYDVTHPRALDVLKKFYALVGAYVDQEPRIFAVSVADVPRFRISDEPMRRGFIDYLRQVYESNVDMNMAWQTRLPSFDDVPIRWDWDKRAYQAHLQRYHRNQATGFFSWIVNAFGSNDRDVPLTFTAPNSTFAIGGAKDGIDIEVLNRTFAASGIQSAQSHSPGGYGLPFPGAQMQVTLMRSLNPTKPVFDFDAVVGRRDAASSRTAESPLRERARLWQLAMAGVDLSVTPSETLVDIVEGRIGLHDARDLAGFISGGETLNRLAGIVQRFQQQAAPVAILWSDSSRMLDGGSPYLPSLRRAYEGAASFGLPVRFISERQAAAGELDQVAVLILPDAPALADDAFDVLDKFVADGGQLVSIGSSLPYDPYGVSRSLRLRASPSTKLVRGGERPIDYLRALDAAVDALGMDDTPRAVDRSGFPMLGVVSRYLEDDQGRYLYLVNLNLQSERIHLPVDHLEGRDLIDGRPVRFPLVLEPLDPMLIALSPPESGEVDPESTDSPSSDPPVALIEPVVQES